MTPLSERIRIHDRTWVVQFEAGRALIVATSNPLAMMPPHFVAYSALFSWRETSEPVGMIVIVNESSDDFREVYLVFADPALRRSATRDSPSIPVAIGRALLSAGVITHHSADRNDAGDRWARAVGGVLPERDERQVGHASERHGGAALARMNQLPWPDEVRQSMTPESLSDQ